MNLKSIKFKLTTSPFKCHLCKKGIRGEEGFIHIKCEKDFGHYSGISNVRICWKCLTQSLNEFEEDRKDRKAKYLELTKEAIIRRLE